MESALKTLRSIGLTDIEAQIYVCLTKKGPCNKKELAMAMQSTVKQLDYNLKNLQTKGFVNYTIVGTIISAVPLGSILDNLEKAKLDEVQRLKLSKDKILINSKK